MTKFQTPDFTKAFENLFSGADFTAFNDVIKNSTEFNSKFGKIALEAAEKNAELTQAWTKETLNQLEGLTKTQKDPADYAKVISEFTTDQAKATTDRVAAFAEVAQKAQMETIELFMNAGKDIQTKTQAAAKKATRKVA